MVNVGMKSIKQPFEFMGVKFAPLVIPFERRLQVSKRNIHKGCLHSAINETIVDDSTLQSITKSKY